MSTPIQPVPDAVLASEFPSLADRPAGTYNAKAKAWADTSVDMAENLRDIAVNAHSNAVAAEERATTADGRATDAESAKGLAETARDKAQEWAESDGEPEPGSKSAKGWAGDSEVYRDAAIVAAAAAGASAGLPSMVGQEGKALMVQPGTGGGPPTPGWGIPAVADFQEFTTSGTWTKPEGANFVAFHIVAAGGSGRNNGRGSCGGQGLFFILPADLVPASSAVIVGASTSADGGNSEFLGFVAKGGTAETGTSAEYTLYYGKITSSSGGADLLIGSRGLIESYGSSNQAAGHSVYGGGGGTNSTSESARGLSTFAGNGGLRDEPGQFPGGGAGAATVGITSGASGVVRVWCW